MTQPKSLSEYTKAELAEELIRRKMEELGDQPTMTQMELAAESMLGEAAGRPSVAAMLSRMKPEKPTAKCPRCGKRAPVKARDRERTVQSLSGPVTFRRQYHYCDSCQFGFYPVDRLLGLPEGGDLTGELEMRVLDFAVNEPFEEGAARWLLHYRELPISANLLRRVADRVGVRCEQAEGVRLQHALQPGPETAPAVLVVATDGSMLPMRGEEPWKEAKVAVLFRQENYLSHRETKRGQVSQARYVATMGGQEVFAKELDAALTVEKADSAVEVAWLGDGAPSNWTLADELRPGATQILDWYHAVEHLMDCGKALLGEGHSLLPLWSQRAEQLLLESDIEATISELMACLFGASRKGRQALNDVIRYIRTNQHRMNYAEYLERGLPIGSGFVESAHRHVLQTRMKCAGQHWSQERAARMTRLRAAYRTAGPARFHSAINAAAA